MGVAKAFVLLGLGLLVVSGGGAAVCTLTSLDCRGELAALVGRDGSFDPPPRSAPGPASFSRDGLVEERVVRGLVEPTDFAFLPDGRILVSEKRGAVRLVSNGRLAPRLVLDLRETTATAESRGMTTVAADPSFPKKPYIYVLRTLGVADPDAPTTARLSRFTLDRDTARPGSELVLIGSRNDGSCLSHPASDDCLPADHQHIGGQIHFDRDGMLLISTGDGGGGGPGDKDAISIRAQDVNALGGKIVRITRTGKGVATNPYWNGNPDANRSKVWARGLRNPFRWTFDPNSEALVVADLGEDSDEISFVRRGNNAGWPCFEGGERFSPHQQSTGCVRLYASGAGAVTKPAIVFGSLDARSLVGGVFYSGDKLPSEYTGSYFFADFIYGWIKTVRFGKDGRPLGKPQPFGSNLSGPVALHQGPDGFLYYLSYLRGTLERVKISRSSASRTSP